MSPAHLSGSVECLEVLYKYGANMAALDENGRSPLFVACAMNRSDVAEYLINCLDETETSLLTKDKRGDTPLHAASCNGSVDTLLLLLQYGIDPLIVNDKGLKAIDLAIRNKQRKCQEMLAEYHLHYSTSSEFDSVLFLATLEGHKLVKEGLMSPNNEKKEKETYDIIKKNMSEAKNPADKSHLIRAKSLFSLKHNNKSLRLQKWGSWIAYEDQLHCMLIFIFNIY
jgi:ankyrin repeat protein